MENILNFPVTTLVNTSVPKNAFWQRAARQNAMKEFLTEEFESITWLYKLAASTLNVDDGKDVHEVDVFYCKMKNDFYSINPFCEMDKLLPRHTLYIIEYGKAIDIIMHHKETVKVSGEVVWHNGNTEMKRSLQGYEELAGALKIEGLNMDAVYINLLNQVSGLNAIDGTTYKEQVELRKQIESLTKQINTLQRNIQKERQFNIQIEMNGEARELKKKLAELKSKLN